MHLKIIKYPITRKNGVHYNSLGQKKPTILEPRSLANNTS